MNGIEDYTEWVQRADAAIETIEEDSNWELTIGARQLLIDLLVVAAVETRPDFLGEATAFAPTFTEPHRSVELFEHSVQTIRTQIAELQYNFDGPRVLSGIGIYRLLLTRGNQWLGRCPGPYD